MATIKTTTLTSFCNSPKQVCHLARPERYHELISLKKPVIARGQGNSYGDAPLNENGHIILMERLDRILEFDPEAGFITLEAGATLKQVLSFIVQQGWFLPVSPGTQNVSMGGCVATDVHGKNHSAVGSLANHLRWLELILANGTTLRCSPQESPEIFWATVGGMGLTGIIGTVSLRLKPIHSTSMIVKQQSFTNLEQLLQLLDSSLDEYNIGWLDTLNPSENNDYQGIFSCAQHAKNEELTNHQAAIKNPKKSFSIPINIPWRLLNKTGVRLFNKLYYQKQCKKKSPFATHYQNYFYPLDTLSNWNQLYGRKGFLQYQCVIPKNVAKEAIEKILALFKNANYPIFLATVKKLGPGNAGFLSYATEGVTLALDVPMSNTRLFDLLNEIDELVLLYQGRVYLAKDFRLTASMFQKMYPQHEQWLKIKNAIDPHHIFSSSLSRRLELC